MSTSEANTAFTSTSVTVLQPDRRRLIVTSAPDKSWRDGVVGQLQALIRLDHGWDGYNGKPTNFEVAYFALQMMDSCCSDDVPEPAIFPGPNGDLQLDWHSPDVKIELHVRAPNDVVAWHANAQTGPDGEELVLTTDFIEVEKWLNALVRANRAVAATAAA